MRKAINGLSLMVEQTLDMNPFDHAVFLFCNRERRILKALYWDKTGFAMWQKRLEKHRYAWPQTEEAVREIDEEKLAMLLDGIDFWHAHEELSYEHVG